MHVIAYKLTDADDNEHRRLIEALEEYGAVKIDEVNTLWKVKSKNRDSQTIYQSLKRRILKCDIDADSIHLWIAKYDPSDVKYVNLKM